MSYRSLCVSGPYEHRFPLGPIIVAGKEESLPEMVEGICLSPRDEKADLAMTNWPATPERIEDLLLQTCRLSIQCPENVSIEGNVLSVHCNDIHFPSHIQYQLGGWREAAEAAITWSENHRPDMTGIKTRLDQLREEYPESES